MTGAEAAATLKAMAMTVRHRTTITKAELYALIGDSLGEACHGCLRRTREADRKRTERGQNRDGPRTLEGHIRDAERTESGQTPDVSPLHPPLSPSGSGSSPENSPSLSASSEPDSKRARRTKRASWRRVPDDWQPNETHRAMARDNRLNLERELEQFRDWEFKDPKTDADAAFRRWLRTAGNSPITQPGASSRDGVPIVQHPRFRPEPVIPASERPSMKEIDGMLSKVGRVAR